MKKLLFLFLIPLFLQGQTKNIFPQSIVSSNNRTYASPSSLTVIAYPANTTSNGITLTWLRAGDWYTTSSVENQDYDIYVNGSLYSEDVAWGNKITLSGAGSANLIAADTTAMIALTTDTLGTIVYLRKLSAADSAGAGLFVLIDSTWNEDSWNYFDSGASGKQWQRLTGAYNIVNLRNYTGTDSTRLATAIGDMSSIRNTLIITEDLDLSAGWTTKSFSFPVFINGNGYTITGDTSIILFDFRNSATVENIKFSTFKSPLAIYNIGDDTNGNPDCDVNFRNIDFHKNRADIHGHHSHSAPENGTNYISQLNISDCFSDSSQKGLVIEDIAVHYINIDNWSVKRLYASVTDTPTVGLINLMAWVKIGYDGDNFTTWTKISNCNIDSVLNRLDSVQNVVLEVPLDTYGIINYRKNCDLNNNVFNYFMLPDSAGVTGTWVYNRRGHTIVDHNVFRDCGVSSSGQVLIKHNTQDGYEISNNTFEFTAAYLATIAATTNLSSVVQTHLHISSGTNDSEVNVNNNKFFRGEYGVLHRSRSGAGDSVRTFIVANNKFYDFTNFVIYLRGGEWSTDIINNEFFNCTSSLVYHDAVQNYNITEKLNIDGNRAYDCIGTSILYRILTVPHITFFTDNKAASDSSIFSMFQILDTDGYYNTDTTDVRLFIRDNIISKGNKANSNFAYAIDGKYKLVEFTNNYVESYDRALFIYDNSAHDTVETLYTHNNNFVDINDTGFEITVTNAGTRYDYLNSGYNKVVGDSLRFIWGADTMYLYNGTSKGL